MSYLPRVSSIKSKESLANEIPATIEEVYEEKFDNNAEEIASMPNDTIHAPSTTIISSGESTDEMCSSSYEESSDEWRNDHTLGSWDNSDLPLVDSFSLCNRKDMNALVNQNGNASSHAFLQVEHFVQAHKTMEEDQIIRTELYQILQEHRRQSELGLRSNLSNRTTIPLAEY